MKALDHGNLELYNMYSNYQSVLLYLIILGHNLISVCLVTVLLGYASYFLQGCYCLPCNSSKQLG